MDAMEEKEEEKEEREGREIVRQREGEIRKERKE